MKIINKDILTVESGVIVQQVNCMGVMGSGLAKSIRDKWPIVYDRYADFCREISEHHKAYYFKLLGECQIVEVGKGLFVANIFGQYNFGTNQRLTDYCALKVAFEELGVFHKEDVYFPYKFGCGLGGGDWGLVSKMIDYYFPNALVCKI